MFLVPQGLCFPHAHNRELDSVEMTVTDIRHRITDVNQDAVSPQYVSTPPTAMKENDTESYPQTNSVLEKEDVGETKPFHTHADDALGPQHAYFTAPGIERNGSPSLEFTPPSMGVESGRADVVDEVNAPNIIIFGEAGVGKSSVINLIAGRKRAHISNDALGCTFQSQRLIVMLDRMPFAFWDTTGLDEGSEGRVPAKLAEINLRALMGGLAHAGGIHFVIYCIRGTRLTKALKHNYDLFYTAVCRKKVPVALVVTGLEHQQGDMETWWDENRVALQRCGMWFDAHACVTTLDVDDAVIQARRSYSQRRLRELVVEHARRRPWKIEASLISWVTFRNILRGVSSMGQKTTRRVIIYDGTPSCRTHAHLIGDRQLGYEVVYVGNPLTQSKSGKLADVLVFYTSPLLGTRIPSSDVAALKIVYGIAGGNSCPVIVVLRGCNDDQVARRCWDALAVASELRYRDIQAHPVVDEQANLDAMIEELCIEQVEVKTSRLHRAYETVMELFAAVVRWW